MKLRPKTKNQAQSKTSAKAPEKAATETTEPINPEQGYEDPLSEITRKERRNLLVSNVALVAMVWGSLVPTKIAAFGIDLVASERYSLLAILFAINVYFLAAFWLYARVDNRVWITALAHAEGQLFEAYTKPSPEEPVSMRLGGPSDELPEYVKLDSEVFFLAWKKSQDVYRDRRLFDIYFPTALTFLVWLTCAARLIWRGI